MASNSGFIRKAPARRLCQFFESRRVDIPNDFDWTSEGRGSALVRSIDALLDGLPGKQQDGLKAELDLLASLSDGNGMLSADQVCRGHNVDLEGLEGTQDILLLLAIEHPQILDRVAAQASLLRRTGGKKWSSFQFEDDGTPWALDDEAAREAFLDDAIEILELPRHRQREADWYKMVRVHPITGEETDIVRATIYVQDRAESELAFGPQSSLERQIVQKVVEVGLACNPMERIVEVCARGGKKVLDEYARSFTNHFAPGSKPPVEVPRREVTLERLRRSEEFETEPADGIERVEVSALDFFSSGGGFCRVERRGQEESTYQFLERRFGDFSPLKAGGWQIVAATIRIVLAQADEKRKRTLTVTLRTPNTTTLPNKTETDRKFVFDLLERWRLLAPPPDNDDLFEAA